MHVVTLMVTLAHVNSVDQETTLVIRKTYCTILQYYCINEYIDIRFRNRFQSPVVIRGNEQLRVPFRNFHPTYFGIPDRSRRAL